MKGSFAFEIEVDKEERKVGKRYIKNKKCLDSRSMTVISNVRFGV